MKPRVGTGIIDRRSNGSPAILSTWLNHDSGVLETKRLDGLFEMRSPFGSESNRAHPR
jgi:hypothetical protein